MRKIFKMFRVFVFLVFACMAIAQDIVFPGETPKRKTEQTQLRMSVKPKKCPMNMTIIDEKGNRTCECVAGYIYYPPLDACFKPYTRGPCTAGEHFILRPTQITAECVKNSCNDDFVLYENACHKLFKTGAPCKDDEVLTINEENYEINCEEVTVTLYQVIVAPVKRCTPGSRMAARGHCRRAL